MKKNLLWARYYLEILSVPIFAFLVVDLFAHGLGIFMSGGHAAHGGDHHGEEDIWHHFLETLLSLEAISGIVFLTIAIYIWHKPMMRRWVPCTHDYCYQEQALPHILATLIFCLHFFADSAIRYQLFANNDFNGIVEGSLGMLGFLAHFLVDIIVALVISSYWQKSLHYFISLTFITSVWLIAFLLPIQFDIHIGAWQEAVFYLLGSFILAMFIHRPHKPQEH